MQKRSGFSVLIIIFLLVGLIAGVLLMAFAVKKDKVAQIVSPGKAQRVVNTEEAAEFFSPAPVSPLSDLNTIEKELNSTMVGSPDNDFMSLESSASGL